MKFLIILLFPIFIFSQNKEYDWSFGFYNVENLFDTIDNLNKDDDEYLPNSERRWNSYKYWQKQKQIAKVLRVLTGENPPTIIGICEIENKLVLKDLITRDPLKKHNYKIITFESSDRRGIQVGFLYKEKYFKILKAKPLVVSEKENDFFTRDILYVKGIMMKKDTIHFFINHWSSRWGGKYSSEYRRMKSSNVLLKKINSLKKNQNIFIAGDFNDEPFDKSIQNILENSNHKLKNISEKASGTYVFKGYLGILDQIIISEGLYKNSIHKKTQVFKNKFLIDENSKDKAPFRSYKGYIFIGGYSDHFPIFENFFLSK